MCAGRLRQNVATDDPDHGMATTIGRIDTKQVCQRCIRNACQRRQSRIQGGQNLIVRRIITIAERRHQLLCLGAGRCYHNGTCSPRSQPRLCYSFHQLVHSRLSLDLTTENKRAGTRVGAAADDQVWLPKGESCCRPSTCSNCSLPEPCPSGRVRFNRIQLGMSGFRVRDPKADLPLAASERPSANNAGKPIVSSTNW